MLINLHDYHVIQWDAFLFEVELCNIVDEMDEEYSLELELREYFDNDPV